MGDFEEVFGAGADCESIIDGFSRSAMREAEEEAEEQRRLNASIWLDAKIEASDYSLYLENYEAVHQFDKAAQIFEGVFAFAFTRRREGAGYRVIVDRKSHQGQTYFSRSSRIVVVASQDDATDYAARSGAHILEIFQQNMFHQKVELDPLIFDYLDAGLDVVVLGWGLENTILNAIAPFVGWSKMGGFAPITDKNMLKTYYCHSYAHKPKVRAFEGQDQPYTAPSLQKSTSNSLTLAASRAPEIRKFNNNGLKKIERERLSLPLMSGAAYKICKADNQLWEEAAAKRAARKSRKHLSKPKVL